MSDWKLPMIDGKPAVGWWHRGRRTGWKKEEYEWIDPPEVKATLHPVNTFKSRSTAGIIFEDLDGNRYMFTATDLFDMIPYFESGEITGIVGWKKQGTAYYNTFKPLE